MSRVGELSQKLAVIRSGVHGRSETVGNRGASGTEKYEETVQTNYSVFGARIESGSKVASDPNEELVAQ